MLSYCNVRKLIRFTGAHIRAWLFKVIPVSKCREQISSGEVFRAILRGYLRHTEAYLSLFIRFIPQKNVTGVSHACSTCTALTWGRCIGGRLFVENDESYGAGS
jgi:hypothetical protein